MKLTIIPIRYASLLFSVLINNNHICNSFQQHKTLLPTTLIKFNTKQSISRKAYYINTQLHSSNNDQLNTQPSSTISSSSSCQPETILDDLLENNKLKESVIQLKSNPDTKLNKNRFINIFKTIEYRTSEADENLELNQQPITTEQTIEYPTAQSESRMEMTDMYSTMKELGHLRLFGATRNVLPAAGSKVVTPALLEQITELSMESLTPKPTGTLLIAGVILGLLEGVLSLYFDIPLEAMVIITLLLGLLDKLLVNGAIFETFSRWLMPGLSNKILRHEAGHFLIAYLIGCPVEGCVLSSWAALQDARFGGSQRNSLSAGTSFFDPDLSEQVNGKKPLSRDSIDRFTMVVMAGISAEAINFGQADGGAGDEMSLITFLGSIRPRSGSATPWTTDGIRNQARWGALQAVLMLKEYKASYEALVDALERGGGLGECIYAIESAGRQEDLYELNKPLGYVLDKGLYGEWSLENEDWKPLITTNISKVNEVAKDTSTTANTGATKTSSEEILQEYRNSLEQRLKDVDEKLGNL